MKHGDLPRRAGVVVLALFAHLLALFLLGLRVPGLAGPDEDHVPAMQVTLMRTQLPQRAPQRSGAPQHTPSASRVSPGVLVTPTPGGTDTERTSAEPPVPSQAETSPNGPNLRNALRGLIGCADPAALSLSREERAACDQRLAAAAPAPVGSLLSPKELEQFNADKPQDSILVHKLHNGCLPRLGDRPLQSIGRPLATRSGVTTAFGSGCAWSF